MIDYKSMFLSWFMIMFMRHQIHTVSTNTSTSCESVVMNSQHQQRDANTPAGIHTGTELFGPKSNSSFLNLLWHHVNTIMCGSIKMNAWRLVRQIAQEMKGEIQCNGYRQHFLQSICRQK